MPENSNDPFKPKEYDIYNAVLGVTEQIHGNENDLCALLILSNNSSMMIRGIWSCFSKKWIRWYVCLHCQHLNKNINSIFHFNY